MQEREINFLIGSGVSFKDGMPAVLEITESMRSGNWRRRSDAGYMVVDSPSPILEQKIFLLISDMLDATGFYKNRDVTYEDVYSVLKQFDYFASGFIENPTTFHFFNELQERLCSLIETTIPGAGIDEILNVILQSCYFIDWVVWHKLRNQKQPLQGFELLQQIEASNLFEHANVFTLNHDTLIENRFPSDYSDGFCAADSDIFIFERDGFDVSKFFQLYKLHGSIDWFEYRDINDGTYKTGKSRLSPMRQRMQTNRRRFRFMGFSPEILSGYFIKESQYSFSVYADLFQIFHEKLRSSKVLFISGYGWGDPGINKRLFNWLQYFPDTKVVLLYYSEKQEPPEYIRLFPDVFMSRFVHVNKWLSDCCLEDIKPYFF